MLISKLLRLFLFPLMHLSLNPVNAAYIYDKEGNKLDLYGRVNARHIISGDTSSDGDGSYVRFGFKGETQINQYVVGYGQWEYQVSASKDEASNMGGTTRLAYVGLKLNHWGSVDYGRNFGILFDAESYTDMLSDFGGDTMAYPDNFLTSRTTGVLTLRNRDFFGYVDNLAIAVQYQGKNDDSNIAAINQNGAGYGFSLGYNDIGGSAISIVGAYAHSQRTYAQQQLAYGKGDRAEAWAASVKYDDGYYYLAATYNNSRNLVPISVDGRSGLSNKNTGIEFVAQYQLSNGFRPSLGYVQSKASDLEGLGSRYLKKYTSIGATYYFNKNLFVSSIYKINLIKNGQSGRDATNNVLSSSINYKF